MITRLTGTLESIDGSTAVLAASGAVAYEVLLPAYLARFLEAGDGLSGGDSGRSAAGRVVRLHTLHYLESHNQGASFTPRLIGFGSPKEREFFELLTEVKGLGNRRALRALTVEPGVVARAIVERDTRVLQKLPEIGPKLAESLVHELKSKADEFVSLRVRVELVALDGASAAPEVSRGPVIETKALRTESAAGGPEPAQARSGKSRKGSSDASGQQEPPRTPPVRATVQALVALGEPPLEAERMVARAVDRAAAAGDLSPVLDTSALLAAAYAAR